MLALWHCINHPFGLAARQDKLLGACKHNNSLAPVKHLPGICAPLADRFVQRCLLPQLARTLLPLRPNQHEIETVLHELKQHGLRIGKKIKAPALMQALRNAQSSPSNVGI